MTGSLMRVMPYSAARSDRLVSRAAQEGPVGSSGWIWTVSATLSSTTSTRRPVSRTRSNSARSAWSSGMACGCSPSTRSQRPSTWATSAGRSSAPLRSANSCPSGNRLRSRWSARRARAVLPTPGMPQIATMDGADRVPGSADNTVVMRSSSAWRPVKSGRSPGSRQTGDGGGPGAGRSSPSRARCARRSPGPGSTPRSSARWRRICS